jgi:hypothetical protein
MRIMEIECWVPQLPLEKMREFVVETESAAFFGSKAFFEVLETGIAATRILKAEMEVEPRLRWSRNWGNVPVLRLGALHVAVIIIFKSAMSSEENEPDEIVGNAVEDAGTVARWLDKMGGPNGLLSGFIWILILYLVPLTFVFLFSSTSGRSIPELDGRSAYPCTGTCQPRTRTRRRRC